MYSQFRAQYPTGCLTTELLHIQQGQYVVQANVLVGGVTLATGLSAAATVEEAEDIARARALIVLGIESEQYESHAHLLAEPDLDRPAQLNPAKPDPLSSVAPVSLPDTEEWANGEAESPEWFPRQVSEDREALVSDTDAELGHPMAPAPAKSKKRSGGNRGRRRTQEAPSSAPAKATGPIDLSEIIAQTDVELRRLGWTSVQGRQYLQQTYNKRSRQQLTDEELMEFLHTLQAQTTDQEPPF